MLKNSKVDLATAWSDLEVSMLPDSWVEEQLQAKAEAQAPQDNTCKITTLGDGTPIAAKPSGEPVDVAKSHGPDGGQDCVWVDEAWAM